MILIFDLIALMFLIYIGHRLYLVAKDREYLKKELELEPNSESSKRVNYLSVFLFFMVLLVGLVSFTYIKLVITHIKGYIG